MAGGNDPRPPGRQRSPGAPDELSTIARPRVDLEQAAQRAAYRIEVVDGDDAGKFVVVDADSGSLIVGSGPASALTLSDRSVSRRHISVEVEQGLLRARDLGSRNGTFVDTARINDALLSPGTHVRLGQTTVLLSRTTQAPQTTSGPLQSSFGSVVGASPAMRRMYPLLTRLAAADVPVLLEGETGTGKETVAESIHRQGSRRAGPFVVFDCTAVPPNLIESELFGHEKGSFTGATASRKGVFERASEGTLLIDEIGDLDLFLQPKLLRVIERGELQRVGGDTTLRVNVRILAATRRDLDAEIQAGRFRDDLFHRLVVARIELPPLRRRREDIRALVAHFATLHGRGLADIPEAVLSRWERADWPGNVRELRNAVARQLVLGDLATLALPLREDEGVATAPHESDWLDALYDPTLPLAEARQRVVDEFERRYVEAALRKSGGSVVQAAAAAGVAKRYFQLLKAKGTKKR